MPDLIAPTTARHSAWMDCHREWGPGLHEDGFGLRATDDVDSPEGFAVWVRRLNDRERRTTAAGGEAGPSCTFRWIVEGADVLGGIALRHWLDEGTELMGHVGYGVRPTARGRGVASSALTQIIEEAGALGLDRVSLVCEAGNAASARVIEKAGGLLGGVLQTEHGPTNRFWIRS